MNWLHAREIFISSFGIVLILVLFLISVSVSIGLRWAIMKIKPSTNPNKWLLFSVSFLLVSNCLFLNEESTYIKAHSGNSQAQLKLGWWYSRGMGFINQSDQKALYWFMKASNQGNIQAQTYLGYAYEKGMGTPQNLDQAIFWYTKASQAGNKPAGERLQQIANRTHSTNHTKSEQAQ